MTSIARLLLPLVVLCTGCTVTVAQLNPSPNLDMAPTSQSLSLKLEDAVRDSLAVAIGPGRLDVNEWRHSLERGFTNAFTNSYALGNGNTELTLQLLEASPDLVFGSAGGENSKAIGQIRYKARLLDAQGNIVKRLTGTAIGRKEALNRDGIPLALQSAVETMYEEIAVGFFGAAVSGVNPPVTN